MSKDIIHEGNPYQLVDEDFNIYIQSSDARIFRLLEGGMGPRSSHLDIAKKVVDFLNEQPKEK
jgi:hypothetical protein